MTSTNAERKRLKKLAKKQKRQLEAAGAAASTQQQAQQEQQEQHNVLLQQIRAEKEELESQIEELERSKVSLLHENNNLNDSLVRASARLSVAAAAAEEQQKQQEQLAELQKQQQDQQQQLAQLDAAAEEANSHRIKALETQIDNLQAEKAAASEQHKEQVETAQRLQQAADTCVKELQQQLAIAEGAATAAKQEQMRVVKQIEEQREAVVSERNFFKR